MYKLTKLDGKDFYTGTVDYAGNIGKIIRLTDYDISENPCGKGLHASENPNDCFIGASIPCRAFVVQGIDKLAGDAIKSRYKALKIIREIEDLDKLFGWKYGEATISSINPFQIIPPKINDSHIKLLNDWAPVWTSVWASVGDSVRDSVRASVRNSVWDSVRDSVRDSVGASVRDSVWTSVWDSVGDSVRDSVWASVRAPVWTSVWDSVEAYIGSLFPNIKKWKYVTHTINKYPFQSCVDLWRQGLVPSFDLKTWRLHGGKKAQILYENTV